MWFLIAVTCLLMLPMALAAVVYLITAAWRATDALLQGTIGAVRITWRATQWTWRATCWTLRKGRSVAVQLRDWHHTGSTWAGQVLETHWLAWSNMARRRYIASQLRRMRRQRVHK